MDLTSPETIKFLLKKYGIKPSKDRGQNFLISRDALDKILAAARLSGEDDVLEIGPGFGVLTRELAERAGWAVAVEADKKIIPALVENVKNYGNVEIVAEDILKFSAKGGSASGGQTSSYRFEEYEYKIVANLPYQITSAIFKKFLNGGPRPAEMVVMVQKEVAERICAEPGETSLLSLSVQFYGAPEIVAIVPRNSFWPEPEVDSAILKISQIKKVSEENIAAISPERFFKIAKIGFSARRKQLHNNLAGGMGIKSSEVQKIFEELSFDPKIRAQDLAISDWIRLALAF